VANMLIEVWREPDGAFCGCFAGPMGDQARTFLAVGASLLHRYSAASHFDACVRYNQLLAFEPYTSPWEALDCELYPDAWAATQVHLDQAGVSAASETEQ
jgi:hypothetical protein